MNFKQIKEKAYQSTDIDDLMPLEKVFVLAIGNLYTQYQNGLISREYANRQMTDIKKVFSKCVNGFQKFDNMVNMLGKTVNAKVGNTELNGIVKQVNVRIDGLISYEVLDNDSNNSIFTADADNVKEIGVSNNATL